MIPEGGDIELVLVAIWLAAADVERDNKLGALLIWIDIRNGLVKAADAAISEGREDAGDELMLLASIADRRASMAGEALDEWMRYGWIEDAAKIDAPRTLQ